MNKHTKGCKKILKILRKYEIYIHNNGILLLQVEDGCAKILKNILNTIKK